MGNRNRALSPFAAGNTALASGWGGAKRGIAVLVTFLLVLSGMVSYNFAQNAAPAKALTGDVVGSVNWPADADLRAGGVFAIGQWVNQNTAFGPTGSGGVSAIVGSKATPTRAIILRNTANTGYRDAYNLAVSANAANNTLDGIWTTPMSRSAAVLDLDRRTDGTA